MCWSAEASIAMTGIGAVAAGLSYHRGAAPAIWGTLGFFALMEGLQVWGYAELDQCGTAANRNVTILSYLHIAIQPFFINAFAMELVPVAVKRRVRGWVYGACAVSTLVMLAQLLPHPALGTCLPGSALCAQSWCTVSGNWHIAWNVPYNGLLVPVDRFLGLDSGFPGYLAAAFLVPLAYGAWRFVLMHALMGPILAASLTTNPNEMPAIWCLFSIAILLIALFAPLRRHVTTTSWWGRAVDHAA